MKLFINAFLLTFGLSAQASWDHAISTKYAKNIEKEIKLSYDLAAEEIESTDNPSLSKKLTQNQLWASFIASKRVVYDLNKRKRNDSVLCAYHRDLTRKINKALKFCYTGNDEDYCEAFLHLTNLSELIAEHISYLVESGNECLKESGGL